MTCKSESSITVRLKAVLREERTQLIEFLRLLGGVDVVNEYLRLGYSSLYKYCVEGLGLSEHEAYLRMKAARVACRHPLVLELMKAGRLHMSGVQELSRALEVVPDPEALIRWAAGRSKRDIAAGVAEICPREIDDDGEVTDVSPGRVHLSVTMDEECEILIEEAKNLGAPEEIGEILRASLLVYYRHLLNRKLRTTSAPGRPVSIKSKKDVWYRDEGRCTFVGVDGRCTERKNLHFDHIDPIARQKNKRVGPEDLRLLCPAHNLFMAKKLFGSDFIDAKIRERRATRSSRGDTNAATRSSRGDGPSNATHPSGPEASTA